MTTEAENKILEYLANMQEKPLVGATMTIDTLVSQWFTWKKPRWRVNTYDNYHTIYELHVKPQLGNLMLTEVTTDKIQAVVDDMSMNGFSVSMMTTAFSKVLYPALQYAEDRDYIRKRPAKCLLPKKEKDEAARRSLTPEEITSLFHACKDQFLWIALPLLLYTGLRRGELLALRWDDISVEDDVLIFDVSKSYVATVGSGNRLEGTKNRFSTRKVGLKTKEFISMLKEYRATFGKGKTYVLSQINNDKMIDPNNFRRTFKRWSAEAGCPEVTPHYCRYTYITQLIDAGVPLIYIAEQVGHKDLNMILTIYADRKISKERMDCTENFADRMSALIA